MGIWVWPRNFFMALLEPFLAKGHDVYIDKYNSSPKLVAKLKIAETGVTRTVRANRKHFPIPVSEINTCIPPYCHPFTIFVGSHLPMTFLHLQCWYRRCNREVMGERTQWPWPKLTSPGWKKTTESGRSDEQKAKLAKTNKKSNVS